MEVTQQKINYVIIGGLGYLGQHLIHTLLQEHPAAAIVVIDKISSLDKIHKTYPEDFSHPKVTFHLDIDLSDSERLPSLLADVEVVFSLAAMIAYGEKNKNHLHTTNVVGIQNLARYAKKAGVKKFIHVSSIATIGCLDSELSSQLATEETQIDWRAEHYCYYGNSKWQGSECVLQENNETFSVGVALPAILIGPGFTNAPGGLPFKFALTKRFMLMPQGGTSFVDVRDVALGLYAMVTANISGKKFLLVSDNISHSQMIKKSARHAQRSFISLTLPKFFRDLVKPMLALCAKIVPSHILPPRESVEKIFQYRYYSNEKALRELNWAPQHSLDETIAETLYWHQKNVNISLKKK
jgi:dihydroflavonol-4-reductase